MVATLSARRIGSGNAPDWGLHTIKEIRRTMNVAVRNDVVKLFNNVIANWKKAPKISSRLTQKTDEIRLTVKPTGKNLKIWRFVSNGTKPHPIPAVRRARKTSGASPKGRAKRSRRSRGRTGPRKKRKILKFKWGGKGSYIPKTLPGGLHGGPGKVVSGKTTFRLSVFHPGSKPREFEENIIKVYRKQFYERIHNAIDRGMQNAWKAA